MTISLKHTFASAKSDGTDSTLVQPSNWNSEHTITLAAGKVLGRDTSAAGAMQELPLAFDSSGNAALSSTGYFTPPVGTTGQRPATGVTGMFRFNSTTTSFEGYNGTTWGSIGGAGTVTSVAVAGGTTGLTTSGGPITGSGTITLSGTLAAANGGTGLAAPGTSGNVLTSNGTAWTSAAASGGVLTGQTIQYGSSTAPTGYLKCDGSTYNISAYSTLAGVLGSLSETKAQYYISVASANNYYSSYANSNVIICNYWTTVSGYVYYSTNSGVSYSTTALTASTTDGKPRGKIVWTGTNYVASNANGSCCGNQVFVCYTTSLASTAWTKTSTFNYAPCNAIVWTGSRVVAVSNSGTMYPYYSTNSGVTFTAGTGISSGFYVADNAGLAYGASIIVAVGSNITYTTPQIFTSPDGATWTARTVPAGVTGTRFNFVTFINSLFVAVDTGNNVISSADGITWTYKGNAGVAGEVVYLSATSTYYMNGKYSSDLITWYTFPFATNSNAFFSTVYLGTDGTRLFSANSQNQLTSYNPFSYTTGTQFVVPNFGTTAIGAGTFGAYSYIKT